MGIEHNTPIISVPLCLSQQDGRFFILLHKKVFDIETYKFIISSAWHDTPIIIYPRFSDKIRSVATLLEKGIIYKEKEKEGYFWTL